MPMAARPFRSGVGEVTVVGGEGLVGDEQGDGWPGGDESADGGGVGGGDVGGDRGDEGEGEPEPRQEWRWGAGAAASQDGSAGGEHHSVRADGECPGERAFAGEGGERARVLGGGGGGNERNHGDDEGIEALRGAA